MAVRTGGPGGGGLSLLLVPLKNHPGVTVRRIKVGGGTTGGTSYIDLDDVKVPVGNLIGQVSPMGRRLPYHSSSDNRKAKA